MSVPSSCSTCPIGLKMNVRPSVLPPQSRPTIVALPDPVHTLEPLSPPPTIVALLLATQCWHSCRICEPCTPVFTHVRDTDARVHPVVRPTLFTTVPTTTLFDLPTTLTLPDCVMLPLFTPVVVAIALIERRAVE